MNGCIKCKGLFEKALYGQLNNAERNFFDAHLISCNECTGEFADYKNILGTVGASQHPEPDESFMDNLWDSLEPQLKLEKSGSSSWFAKLSDIFRVDIKWQYKLAAAVVLFAIGFSIRQFYTAGQPATGFASNTAGLAAQAAVYEKAVNYLAKSEILMLGLMNFNPSTDDIETINISKQQEISRTLLTQAADLKTELNNPQQQQMKKLVSDIEMILLQISNLDPKDDSFGIELVKEGVETKSIILKINIQRLKDNFKEFNSNKNKDKSKNKSI